MYTHRDYVNSYLVSLRSTSSRATDLLCRLSQVLVVAVPQRCHGSLFGPDALQAKPSRRRLGALHAHLSDVTGVVIREHDNTAAGLKCGEVLGEPGGLRSGRIGFRVRGPWA